MLDKIQNGIKRNLTLIIYLSLYSLVFSFLAFVYYKRLAAFGCSDDCFNYIGGYLINKGKTIYSEFFFNHSMLMAYLSAAVQKVADPKTLYELILVHRLSLYAFSFIMGILTIIRFRKTALVALIFYESTKFYVFGDHFLAESFIVYPLIYMLGVVWKKVNKKEVNKFDIILSSIFSWFVIFAREPYVPLVLLLYFIILIGKKEIKVKAVSISIFTILSLITLLAVPLNDFFINIYTYNKVVVSGELKRNELSGGSLINIFFYPVKIFLTGYHNIFREILTVFSFVFLASGFIYTFLLKRKAFLILFIILGISNFRPVIPGLIYYEAFHINVWYGILIFSTFLLVAELGSNIKTKKYFYILIIILLALAVRVLFYPLYFIKEKPDRVTEFNTNYGTYYAYGTVIKNLADKKDTLFLEDADDLIYLVTDINFSYKYYWYTSHMPIIEKYKTARDEMFVKTPPAFYYDACLLISSRSWLEFSKKIENRYVRILVNGKQSCLLIRKDKYNTIKTDRWKLVLPLGFTPPN